MATIRANALLYSTGLKSSCRRTYAYTRRASARALCSKSALTSVRLSCVGSFRTLTGSEHTRRRGALVVSNVLQNGVNRPDTQGPEISEDFDVLPDTDKRPGSIDSQYFKEGPSVAYWKDYSLTQAEDLASRFVEELSITRKEHGELEAVPYWVYHLFRTSFFSVQGAFALAVATANGGSTPSTQMRTPASTATVAARWFLEALIVYRQDYRNIKEGLYTLPFDMEPRHRQFNPFFALEQSLRFLEEATDTLARKAEKASTDLWMDTNLYPSYYRHTFHYQTDGWLSEKSAKVYETSTETLFVGRQDAMQRHTMVPFGHFMKGRDQKPTKVLEIACGTGRFHTFLRDSYPALRTCCSDLSPFYLAQAKKNVDYWESFRGADVASKGSTSFLQANAELLPLEDASFDAVLNVYLFHELPTSARRNVMREVARVLKPGGIFVLTDSLQLGDTPSKDEFIGNFEGFAEPHYRSYISFDFGKLASEFGLVPDSKELASSTKVMSFYKPKLMLGRVGSIVNRA